MLKKNIGPLYFNTLYGVDGTSGDFIANFGVFILIGSSLIKKISKFTYIIILIGIILTLKNTAILVLISGVLLLKLKERHLKYVFLILIISYSLVIILIINEQYGEFVFGDKYYSIFKILMYQITHARSMIWNQQMDIFTLNTYDFFWGNYSIENYEIELLNDFGEGIGRSTSNPHSMFLLFLFRSPLFMITFLFVYIYVFFNKKITKIAKIYYLLFFIVSITNSDTLSLEHPWYYWLILKVLISKKQA